MWTITSSSFFFLLKIQVQVWSTNAQSINNTCLPTVVLQHIAARLGFVWFFVYEVLFCSSPTV